MRYIFITLFSCSVAYGQNCERAVNQVLNFLGHKGFGQEDKNWKSQKFYKENGIPQFIIKNLESDDVSLLRSPRGQMITSGRVADREFNLTYNHFSKSTERLDFRFRMDDANKTCELMSLTKSSENYESKSIDSIESCQKSIQGKNCQTLKTLLTFKKEDSGSNSLNGSGSSSSTRQ